MGLQDCDDTEIAERLDCVAGGVGRREGFACVLVLVKTSCHWGLIITNKIN